VKEQPSYVRHERIVFGWTPARSRCVAVECRSTCGLIRFVRSDGVHLRTRSTQTSKVMDSEPREQLTTSVQEYPLLRRMPFHKLS
jgi:hypothetical protein